LITVTYFSKKILFFLQVQATVYVTIVSVTPSLHPKMAKNIEKSIVPKEEEEEESGEEWCFECKDGGQMVVCDHK